MHLLYTEDDVGSSPTLPTNIMDRVLIAGGDSVIFGVELADALEDKHSNFTYTALLSNSLDRQYICSAFPGNSNSGIARRVINECISNSSQDKLVIVQWTVLSRFELKFTYKPSTPQWSLDKKVEEDVIGTWYNASYVDIVKSPATEIKQLKPQTVNFLEEYFRNVGSDDVYEYYSTLKEIVYLQNFLVTQKIPYIFTVANNFFKSKDLKDKNIQNLLKLINFDNFYFFDNHLGFREWADLNYNPGQKIVHPREPAHKKAAEILQESIQWNSLKTF